MIAEYGPYAVAIVGLLVAAVVGLFVLLRADAVRAGEPFPTKLAIAQTFSALRNGRELVALLRGSKPDKAPIAVREFKSAEEMKATITPGTLRAEDIPTYAPPRRSPAKSDAVE